MITPYLEKLIHDGVAEYRTHVHGLSAVGTINVPSNSYIIITDFIWHPFNDGKAGNSSDPAALPSFNINRVQKTMRLLSGQRKMHYTFRDLRVANVTVASPTQILDSQFLNEPQQFHTYMRCDEIVQIDIWITNLGLGAFDIGKMQVESNELDTPNGYGKGITGLDVQLTATGAGGGFVVPLGATRAPQYATGARWRPELFDDINTGSALNTWNATPINYSYVYPCVTFGYVLINKGKSTKTL